jgi:GNAT superfamily N-acetyltransferase
LCACKTPGFASLCQAIRYDGVLLSEICIVNTKHDHIDACAKLEQICYPSLGEEEKLRPEQFAKHIALFPAGQFVAIDQTSGAVIGCTGGFLTQLDVVLSHSFFEVTSHGWFTRHDNAGEYYHGATMTVHPDYRGLGIARMFYDTRKAMCREFNLRGQVICGMLPLFADFKAYMSAADYVRHVVAGLLFDPTMTVQLRNGFVFRQLLKDYFDDPPSDGWAAVLICPTSVP